MSVQNLLFKNRTFVDSHGETVSYEVYHRENQNEYFLSIQEGVYEQYSINELLEFLADNDIFVPLENTNWMG